MNETNLPAAAKHFHRFRNSLPMRVRLQELIRALGPSEGLTCLDVGAETGVIPYLLRKNGGTWATFVPMPEEAALVREVVAENVFGAEGPSLPFEKKQFDAVVISDSMERIGNDAEFIEECHKVLKPDGRLVINVPRVKAWSVIGFLRRLLGLTPERKGCVREGYTESDLFNVLKDGFDVLTMRSYSKFFVEFVDLWVERVHRRIGARGGDAEASLRGLYRVAAPFYWLAFQVDLLFFFLRGHRLIAVAKRRAWRPRKTPVLVDGRSITEAVLSRAAR